MGLWQFTRALPVALLALLTASCAFFSVSRNDLIGDFQIDYGYGVETLRLTNDGRYTQSFRLANENTWTVQSGAWQFKREPAVVLELHDAVQIDDGAGKPRDDYRKPVAGVRSLPVRKRFGTVSLIVDEGRKLTMKKLPPPTPTKHKPDIIHLPPRNDIEVR